MNEAIMRPRLRLSIEQWNSLPEYSATYPTGYTIGKRWKRLNGIYDESFKKRGGRPYWLVGEFIKSRIHDDRSNAISIQWYKPIIIVPARRAL